MISENKKEKYFGGAPDTGDWLEVLHEMSFLAQAHYLLKVPARGHCPAARRVHRLRES
jgi:hypothetical protein